MDPSFAEHAFGQIDSFQLGVEEELFLVDPATHAVSQSSEQVLAAMEVPVGTAKLEFYAALIEFASPVSRDAADAAGALGKLRAAAAATGAALLGAGLHPASAYGEVQLVPKPRWLAVADVHGRANFRSAEAALHIHVGMPDPETATQVFNGLREHLPLLLALSGNSPYWFGEDSGLASARTIQNRAFQRFDLPPSFSSYEAYADDVAATLAAGELSDYTLVWWHLRIHPRMGTVEVRVMDSQSSLSRVAGLAALVHGLALAEAEGADRRTFSPRQALAESIHRGCRYGMDAKLWHDGALRAVPELARDAVALARAHLVDTAAAPLAEIDRILVEGNGAARQRAEHARGGMAAVLEELVRETAVTTL